MKNIQVIDDAINCAYSIFSASQEAFTAIFPAEGQDIEFADEFINRVGDKRAGEILGALWGQRLDKKDVQGIHGTLFYGLAVKKQFYPYKSEADLDRTRA